MDSFLFGTFNNMIFTFVPAFIFIVFMIVIGTLIKNAIHYSVNKTKPQIPVRAKVVAKRTNISHHHHAGNNMHSSSHTTYYTTFELENGERMELHIPLDQFGYLVEGDKGTLTIQGDMFIAFKRIL
ncbi:MAG: DUF2500 domain-containing protein [Cellulosilyticaceae bacterium]